MIPSHVGVIPVYITSMSVFKSVYKQCYCQAVPNNCQTICQSSENDFGISLHFTGILSIFIKIPYNNSIISQGLNISRRFSKYYKNTHCLCKRAHNFKYGYCPSCNVSIMPLYSKYTYCFLTNTSLWDIFIPRTLNAQTQMFTDQIWRARIEHQ